MPRSRRRPRLLFEALGDVAFRAARLDGFWRVGLPGRNLLDPSRSRQYFGRWHCPQLTGALYFASDLHTAIRELHAHLDPPFPDRVDAIQATVRLAQLLALRALPDDTRLARYCARALADTVQGFFRGALLGEAAFRRGADGILAQCLRGPGPCLCVYVDASPAPVIDVAERRTLQAPWDVDGQLKDELGAG